jgi:mannobiose 2-epimerase
MKPKMFNRAIQTAAWLAMVLLAGSSLRAQGPAPKTGQGAGTWMTRAPQDVIDKHMEPQWLKQNMLDLLEHWRAASVTPNGLIQENLDRTWTPSNSQREASIESQGRMTYAMAIGYEYSQDKRFLDALTKAYDFLMKMHDDQYGGFYYRVNWEGKVLDDTKSIIDLPHALHALANAYRVTKDPKYDKAAMDLFQVMTTKMRDGQLFQDSMSRDFSKPQVPLYMGGPGSPFAGLIHHRDFPDYGPEATGAAPAAGRGAAGGGGRVRHNIHIQVFDSFLDLYEATHSKGVWDEITAELALMAKLYDNDRGYIANTFDENWKPAGGGQRHLPPGITEGARFYQWASVFNRAVELGADPKFIEMGSRSLDLGLKLDYNNALGSSGGFDGQGRPIITFWWSQCELLKALGVYAALHGRSDLWPTYDKTWAFVKKNLLDDQYGGWFEAMVPGWSRAKLAEVSTRAYIKGSLDGSNFDAWHQTLMFRNLLMASQPH